MATLIVDNDVWCTITIDGKGYGDKLVHKPIPITATHHSVHCEQSAKRKWDDVVDLAPGETRTLHHVMQSVVGVTIAVDGATISGVAHRRGEVVELKADRYQIGI